MCETESAEYELSKEEENDQETAATINSSTDTITSHKGELVSIIRLSRV